MIPPLDPFALKFDSIEIDPTRAPSMTAFDHALALAAPTAAAPEHAPRQGFYLLNDAGGRFVVDRDIGIISVKDDALIAAEHGSVHSVRMRVVEPSGTIYQLDMKLRITGRVPQMVGGEEFASLVDLAAAPAPSLTPVTRIAMAQPPRPSVAWAHFSALDDAGAPAPLSKCGGLPYGAMFATSLPPATVHSAALALSEKPPAPSTRSAAWSI